MIDDCPPILSWREVSLLLKCACFTVTIYFYQSPLVVNEDKEIVSALLAKNLFYIYDKGLERDQGTVQHLTARSVANCRSKLYICIHTLLYIHTHT